MADDIIVEKIDDKRGRIIKPQPPIIEEFEIDVLLQRRESLKKETEMNELQILKFKQAGIDEPAKVVEANVEVKP